MTETTVVHVHDGFDKYIGRAVPGARDARCHHRSRFANPFGMALHGRIDATERYERRWRNRLSGPFGVYWRKNLESLRGLRIACWCKRKDREVPCHGDILVKLLKELADGTFDEVSGDDD